jgi:hypothetical protein
LAIQVHFGFKQMAPLGTLVELEARARLVATQTAIAHQVFLMAVTAALVAMEAMEVPGAILRLSILSLIPFPPVTQFSQSKALLELAGSLQDLLTQTVMTAQLLFGDRLGAEVTTATGVLENPRFILRHRLTSPYKLADAQVKEVILETDPGRVPRFCRLRIGCLVPEREVLMAHLEMQDPSAPLVSFRYQVLKRLLRDAKKASNQSALLGAKRTLRQ